MNSDDALQGLTTYSGIEMTTIKLTPLEIIYNKTYPAVKIHLKEKLVQLMVIHLIQEIKRNIVYQRMNAGVHHHRVNLTRLRAHLISIVKKTISLLQYQGTKNHQESITFLMLLEGTINERVLQ